SFAASFAYSHFRLRPINQYALEIIDDAVPSIEHLGEVRTELTRLSGYVTEYVTRVDEGKDVTRGDIRSARRRLGTELEAYRAPPAFGGEIEQLHGIDEDLARLDQAIKLALDQADAHDPAAATRTLDQVVDVRMLETDAAVARLKTLNATRA